MIFARADAPSLQMSSQMIYVGTTSSPENQFMKVLLERKVGGSRYTIYCQSPHYLLQQKQLSSLDLADLDKRDVILKITIASVCNQNLGFTPH